MIRKIIGYTIATSPAWGLLLYFLITNLILTVFVICAFILMIDAVLFILLVVEVGLRIAKGAKL